jgi:hypothetical protein
MQMTVQQCYAPDKVVETMVQRVLDSNEEDSEYTAEVRRRFTTFLCRGPR